MTAAARIDDPIQHSNALTGLLIGAAAGAAIGLFVVFTGGLGAGVIAAAVVGAGAAGGAGLGELLGSLSGAGGSITGGIASGSPDTTVNSRRSARATDDIVACTGTPPLSLPAHDGKHIAQGSATVTINGLPASRVDDKIECGSKIQEGSPNVIIGGATVQTLEIDNEVPGYVHGIVFAVGFASAVVLAGPVVAVVGTLGSLGGGMLAQAAAAQLGLSEDGQKIAGFLGSLLGGGLSGRAGGRIGRIPSVARTEAALMRPLMSRSTSYSRYVASVAGERPMQLAAREAHASRLDPNSQAAAAARFQGTPDYPGRDPLRNTTFRRDELYYGGTDRDGNPTGFFISEAEYNRVIVRGGGTREDYFQGVQVQGSSNPKYITPDNPLGYRNQLSVFRVTRDFEGATGPTVANPRYGAGGIQQHFSNAWEGRLVEVGKVDLRPSPNPVLVPSTAAGRGRYELPGVGGISSAGTPAVTNPGNDVGSQRPGGRP
ncbi:PAAR domain-containing protein [Chondromyces apiculatus]|uniref:Rhs family protein n=1 Tax=Chondromyces apiculatus DSM 436 TaxID=1192034 RepID=A0A017T625_9BACT|nr:PAAR domain-containing protein [Chondromyces apiculatus]EYF04713.1 Rhs family protein [Chondromyces apiculatus DSM 436]